MSDLQKILSASADASADAARERQASAKDFYAVQALKLAEANKIGTDIIRFLDALKKIEPDESNKRFSGSVNQQLDRIIISADYGVSDNGLSCCFEEYNSPTEMNIIIDPKRGCSCFQGNGGNRKNLIEPSRTFLMEDVMGAFVSWSGRVAPHKKSEISEAISKLYEPTHRTNIPPVPRRHFTT